MQQDHSSNPDTLHRALALLAQVRAAGAVVALLVAAFCGWAASGRSDLFEATLQGAIAWVAVLIIWNIAIRLGERLLLSDHHHG